MSRKYKIQVNTTRYHATPKVNENSKLSCFARYGISASELAGREERLFEATLPAPFYYRESFTLLKKKSLAEVLFWLVVIVATFGIVAYMQGGFEVLFWDAVGTYGSAEDAIAAKLEDSEPTSLKTKEFYLD